MHVHVHKISYHVRIQTIWYTLAALQNHIYDKTNSDLMVSVKMINIRYGLVLIILLVLAELCAGQLCTNNYCCNYY